MRLKVNYLFEYNVYSRDAPVMNAYDFFTAKLADYLFLSLVFNSTLTLYVEIHNVKNFICCLYNQMHNNKISCLFT